MEYNYFLPRKKERRERRRKAYLSVSFLPCRKTPYIVAWWRKKTTIALNKGVKTGAETMCHGTITLSPKG